MYYVNNFILGEAYRVTVVCGADWSGGKYWVLGRWLTSAHATAIKAKIAKNF